MSLSCQSAARSCIRSLRSSSSLRIALVSKAERRNPSPARRWASTEASANPKVSGIVDQISQLTLLETADLVASLKVRPSATVEPSWSFSGLRTSANVWILQTRLNIPDMPMGGFAAAPAAPTAAPVEEEEAAPAQQEKTLFNLKLASFDAAAKPKEEAEKIIETLKALGGVVTME
jgi:large subunit ribosomal protein L7/L12